MQDTTWIRINDHVTAEVSFSRYEYNQGARVVEGHLTGRVHLHRDAVQEGMWGLSLPGDSSGEGKEG